MNAHSPAPKLRLPVQRVFVPLLKKRRFRGAHGGRGSGKSHFFGEDLALDMATQHTRAVCAREVQLSIKDSSKQLIEDKIHYLGLTYAGAKFDPATNAPIQDTWDTRLYKRFMSKWRITEREIVYPDTDSLCIFRGLQNHTVSSIKSLEGFTRFWCDEAQGLTKRSVELVVPTFRSNSTLDFSWNPENATDPVDVLFAENKGDPDFVCVEANFYHNKFFPDELRRDMERDKRRDRDKYNHVWLGKYKKLSEALVFRNWSVEEFETPKNARFYFGADWGFSVDPSVLIRCFMIGERLYCDMEAHAVGCEIDNTPALFAGDDKQVPPRWENPNGYKGIPGALDWPMTADSARPETISYMRRRGFFKIRPSIKGQGSVEDGLEFLKNFDIVVHPRCVNLIDELSNYAYKIDKKTQEILPVLEDKKNHVIDALRYALESTRRSNYTLAAVG